MKMKALALGAVVAATLGMINTTTVADEVEVTGGQTSVLLDTALIEAAAGLTLSGVSDAVIAPGNLGPDSVAFGINSRTASDPLLPTTFSYDPDDFLGTFAGTIEHEGSVFFDSSLGTVEVGNFSIGFDANRVGGLGGLASGFFVASTVGIEAVLFDIENPSSLMATDSNLDIQANLLVSMEFSDFLVANGLATDPIAGADVGDAFVEASIPAPGVLALLGLGAMGRRRRRTA